MNTRKIFGAIMALLLLPILQAESAQANVEDRQYMDWQLKRLFEPSERQLNQEEMGFVFIYDGIKSSDIERVMIEQFHRLDNMMFTGIIITDEDGEVVVDPRTGLAMREDDGC